MPKDKADITAALSDWDRIREEGERISREEAYKVLTAEIASLHAENERLRLTDTEREAVHFFSRYGLPERRSVTLRRLLQRLSQFCDSPT